MFASPAGKAGGAEYLEQLGLIERRGAIDQAQRAGAHCDQLRINAVPVVFDINGDQIASGRGTQRDCASAWLASGYALVRRLQTVANGVANQMNQRIEHALDHKFINFGILAAQVECDLLL